MSISIFGLDAQDTARWEIIYPLTNLPRSELGLPFQVFLDEVERSIDLMNAQMLKTGHFFLTFPPRFFRRR